MPRDAVSRTAHVGTVGKNGLRATHEPLGIKVMSDVRGVLGGGTINVPLMPKDASP